MQAMPVIAKLEEMVLPVLQALGFRLILMRLLESGKGRTLQLMAEREDGIAMTVDDCASISRSVSALLDVNDPISGAYQLEVSSPGIDRPLVTPEDFAKHLGYEVKIETVLPVDGRKRFKGTLVEAGENEATVRIAEGDARIAFFNIGMAKLVLTDALVREHLTRAKKARKLQNA